MKTIILTLFCFFVFAFLSETYSQYSLPIRLVNSSGAPLTGQAANIVFTRYPHTYGVDDVSGITVTEIGTAGNYRCRGFTTYEYVKLWLSGVEQTWFDSVQVGSITSYLSSNYMNKTGTQTGFTGTKTLTGDWLWTAGTITMNKPYIYSSSTWYTDYSLPSATSLIWKGYADSVYGIKAWYYDGTKLRLTSSGYKWYGRNSTTAPFEYNTAQLDWSGDKLNIQAAVFNTDSVKHEIITSGKDTTWIVLGEGVTKWRFLSLKKGFWYNSYSVPDWKWVYESYNESGVLQSMDSMMVINEATSVDNETTVSLAFDGTYSKIDSLLLPPGKYTIDFAITWERGDHNDVAQVGISDTIIVALKEQSSAPNSYIINNIRDIQMYVDANNKSGSVLQWSTIHTVYSTPKYIYLYGRYLANALATALSIGVNAGVTRGKIIATLIR